MSQARADVARGARRRQYRRTYLRSNWWLVFRLRALKRAGERCQACGARPRSLDVHHLTYERLGREQLRDVIVLCRPCHRKRHPKRRRR